MGSNEHENRYLAPLDSNPEELDVETIIKKMYKMLLEMDVAGQKKLTLTARDYIDTQLFDESGKIMPTRIDYARKLVENVYFGDFARTRNLMTETQPEKNKNEVSEKKLFIFPCLDLEHPVDQLRIMRITSHEWETANWGGAYSTTCTDPPQWFTDLTPDWESPQNRSGATRGKIITNIDGTLVTITRSELSHENGTDYWQSFVFKSKEDADRFSMWLARKEKEVDGSITFQDKLSDLLAGQLIRTKFFNWKNLSNVDGNYALFADILRCAAALTHGFSRYAASTTTGIQFKEIKKILDDNQITFPTLFTATEEFFASIDKEIHTLTDPAAEALKISPEYLSADQNKRRWLENDARIESIPEQKFRELLDNALEKIVNRAKELSSI